MPLKIHQDHSRFKEIVRGKIKANLRKYVQKGEMLGKKGKDVISIPVPFIDIPHFKYGHKEQGGVGQGDGEIGQQLSPGSVQPGDGSGKAGQGEGDHALEVDVSLEELAEILGEELQLPNIEHRGRERVITTKIKYTGINTTGPESLRHFKRTYKQALKRQIALGKYDPKVPIVIPTREDRRYRSYKLQDLPETNAVIIYMMDVSGSMGDEQKEIVRIESFWLDTWLRHQYKGLEARYIIHDAVAREVDRETFFHTRESGGTMISSAYKLLRDITLREYSPEEWNVYTFQFSDGENWGDEDNTLCLELLRGEILPHVNLFCYGQVSSHYGDGDYLKVLEKGLPGAENVALSKIENKDAIYDSIREFLGKGK